MRTWHRLVFIPAVIVAFVVMYSACSDQPLAPPSVEFPDSNISFNAHVKPILLSNCALSGCHDGYSDAPENPGNITFRLETYADVLSNQLVTPSDPERSSLAEVLRGIRLHPNTAYLNALNDNQRNGIVKWIKEGASNN
ncbi:MAG: hypothetical protein H7X80_02330 [bacterium]|nr:hypothetical protein [Candidatus Kapabacteria bacterium]